MTAPHPRSWGMRYRVHRRKAESKERSQSPEPVFTLKAESKPEAEVLWRAKSLCRWHLRCGHSRLQGCWLTEAGVSEGRTDSGSKPPSHSCPGACSAEKGISEWTPPGGLRLGSPPTLPPCAPPPHLPGQHRANGSPTFLFFLKNQLPENRSQKLRNALKAHNSLVVGHSEMCRHEHNFLTPHPSQRTPWALGPPVLLLLQPTHPTDRLLQSPVRPSRQSPAPAAVLWGGSRPLGTRFASFFRVQPVPVPHHPQRVTGIYRLWLIHSSPEGHVGGFHFLAIRTDAAVAPQVQGLCGRALLFRFSWAFSGKQS